jgi:hypothetical protein
LSEPDVPTIVAVRPKQVGAAVCADAAGMILVAAGVSHTVGNNNDVVAVIIIIIPRTRASFSSL